MSAALPESARKTRDWLKTTRKLDDISVLTAIGMLPRDSDLDRLLDSAGADKDDRTAIRALFSQYLGATYMDCVVYVYAESPDRITGFKLRIPGDSKESTRFIRASDDAPMGVFGVTMSGYAPLFSNDKIESFSVVEGEHDQLTLYQEQVKTGIVDHVYVAAGGNGHGGLDCMAALGMARGDILGDDDVAGRDWAEGLIKKSPKINFRVFRWPANLTGAAHTVRLDPDSAVLLLGGAAVFVEFQLDRNFQYAYDWCYDRARVKLQTVNPDDIVRQLDIAAEYGQALHSEAEHRAYAAAIVGAFPKLTVADVLAQIVKTDESPLTFISQIVSALKRKFIPSHHDHIDNVLYFWDKDSEDHLAMPLSADARAIALLRTRIGGVFYTWVSQEIGLPSWLPDVSDPETGHAALPVCEAKIQTAVVQALATIASTCPAHTTVHDQGIHVASVISENAGYLVNGNKQYKMSYSPVDGTLTRIEQLKAPIDGNKVFYTKHHVGLFYTDPAVGWAEYPDAASMRRKPKFSPDQYITTVTDIFKDVFSFKYPDQDAMYCTLMTLYSNIFDCMAKKVMTHILGEWESGKSSLLCLLANNQQIRGYSLVNAAITTDNYTQAALFQLYGTKRIVVALDEFNDHDDGSRDSVSRQAILSSLRGLATKGQTERVLGSKEGEGKIQRLTVPFYIAGATAPVDPMDLSRFNRIEVMKRDGKVNIGAALAKYGTALFAELRHAAFYHAIHNIVPITRAYAQLYKDAEANTQRFTISRGHENLMPLGAILTAFGGDGIEFINNFINAKQDVKAEKVERSPSEILFSTVMYSPNIEVEINQRPSRRTLMSVLTRADWREYINDSDRGVFFDKVTNYLAVVWPQARTCLLSGQYARMGATTLRGLAQTSSHMVPYKKARDRGVVTRLRQYGMPDDPQQVTFFDVSHIIHNVEAAHKELATAVAAANLPAAPADDTLDKSGL
jgi:hypothetical protein